ncbi:MAG: helix-turn-helix domain-containing protein [Candidatus Nanopelagicales bacterium]
MKIPSEASRRVARSLLVDGPATAPELARRLGLTAAGVRRHLDSLEADGLIESGERPAFGPAPSRGRGRPPRVYSVTAAGRDASDQAYDDLAVSALRFLAQHGGEDAVTAFAQQRAEELERRYLPLLATARDSRSKAEVLAAAMSDDGFAATVTALPGQVAAVQICQHNCPVAHVAGEFPVLCETETVAMARMVGAPVTRLATIAHGDGVCTAAVATGSTGPAEDVTVERIRS